ncbi:lipid-transfer protein [Bacillus sp. AGMB 02131]|uniref:Lipid-transfer protein n=1 Tax=Peribacillus faecalis TaxID=2772559 RepID=A0A927CUC2_9BACI|nr:lipid-transfer protein [Peribacillus faecalis]MBD3107344.1 lipid-transfer protein [Peribacillus faecalis]
MENICDKTAIVGIGETEFSKNCGRSELQMACEAILAAVKDAGLTVNDIDGMVNYTLDTGAEQVDIVKALGIPNLHFFSKTPYGGGGNCGTVAHAVAAVASGIANYVVCVRSIRDASGPVKYGDFEPNRVADLTYMGMYHPYGLLTPVSWDGMFAQRYIYQNNIKDGAFAPVALVNRENANRNPKAQFYDRKLTLEEYMNSPVNVAPLRRHDSCLSSDGAVAVIVTTAERAKDLKQRPAYISAAVQSTASNGEMMTSYYRPDIAVFPEIETYGKRLFHMAGISPWDINVAQIYDAFSPLVPMQLEALGFVGKGEGVDFIQGGDRIRPDGQLPINTAGGLMSEAYIHGMNLITEGVRQIRGTSTTQIQDAELCLVTGGPGVPSSGLILKRR